MTVDLLTLFREAIDRAVDEGLSKQQIICDLRFAIEEVEEDPDIPGCGEG